MHRHGQVTLDWADGTYTFRLGLAELEELEEKFDRSIFVIAQNLGMRTARSTEILHVLRAGLIGGGMDPAEALRKVRRHVDERPLDDNRDTAYAVALQAISRVHSSELEKDDSSGEGEAPETDPSGSTSAPSTQTPS